MKTMPSRMSSRRPALQSGVSLVELMIALTLGLIIVAVLTTLYADMSRTNQEMAKANSQIENARFAMQLLQTDIVHGGYWGGFVPQFDDVSDDSGSTPVDPPTAIPNPCLAYTTPWSTGYINGLLGIAVQAYEDAASSGCSSVVTNKAANTDILVVRHAETCVPGVGNCAANVVGALYFQVSNCELELDASMDYIFGTSSFTRHKRDCTGTAGSPPTIATGTIADKRKFISNIYYIRDYAVTAGDGIPTLMRSSFDLSGGSLQHNAAQPMVEGIERMRIELGIDNVSETGVNIVTDASAANHWDATVKWVDDENRDTAINRGDGAPDGTFVHCTTGTPCTLGQLVNVVAVKIYLLARADTETPGYLDTKTYTLGSAAPIGPFNDGYKRHVFSSTVRLANVSGRRETP